jgi:ABC-type transporter Mla MlaB component
MSCFETSSEGNKAVISIHGEATIEHTGELQQELLKLLEDHDTFELDTDNISHVDIPFLQLLEALAASLDRTGKNLQIRSDTLSRRLRCEAAASGLFRYLEDNDAQPNRALLHHHIYEEESVG